jgi:ribonuclease HI
MRPPTAILCLITSAPLQIHCFATPPFQNAIHRGRSSLSSANTDTSITNESAPHKDVNSQDLFRQFTKFLKSHQTSMIEQIERIDGSGQKFSRDGWGVFTDKESSNVEVEGTGGITRVIQGGDVVEKGACSLTIIENGRLTKERAETISARQEDLEVGEGDVYSAAALSVVLHTRNPFVPVSFHIFYVSGSVFVIELLLDMVLVSYFSSLAPM